MFWLMAALAAPELLVGPTFGQAIDRVQGRIEGSGTFALAGHVRPAVREAQDQGAAPASRQMPRMSIRFRKTAEQESELQQLLSEQQRRGSAQYHRWLTPEAYADRFGVSSADAQKVAEWLRAAGFADIEIPPSRSSVSFSGTAGEVEAAFHTTIHSYVWRGETHIANASDPELPKALEGVVEGIRGLHDFRPKSFAVGSKKARPQYTVWTTYDTFLAPGDFAFLYDLNALYALGIDGSGQRIAVAGESDIALNNVQDFRSAAGLSQKTPQIVLTGRDPGTVSGADNEAYLDVEWAGAVAKNATVIYVNSTDAFTSAAYAVDHNLAPILSISFGDCEAHAGRADLSILASIFEQANTQGMTVLAASGDLGAAACDDTGAVAVASHGLAVSAPASIPYVTGVGGTEFEEFGGSPVYWNQFNTDTGESADAYIPETAWNDTQLVGTLNASGGGKSSVFGKPAWQSGYGVPNDGARDVPDVSLSASPNHDGYLICAAGDCSNGFVGNGELDVYGGTSASTPSMAGIVALIDQLAGGAQGNINPQLYTLASMLPSIFNDTQTGGNVVPCAQGSPDCSSSGSMGYQAGVGYDLVTGLGSVDGYRLVIEWGDQPPVPVVSPPQATTVFAMTADGTLFGENLGPLYELLPGSQTWTEASTSSAVLQQLAAGTKTLWGLDLFGDIYRWDAASETFVQIPGALSDIAVGIDDDAWGVNAQGMIFHFDQASQSWTWIPGELSQIAVGSDGAVWGLNRYDQIFRFNAGTGFFEYVPGALNSIVVGADGGVWGVSSSWNAHHFNPAKQGWDEIGGGITVQGIAAGSGSNVWAVGNDLLPFRYSAKLKTWIPEPGEADPIIAMANGSAYGFFFEQISQLAPPSEPLQTWHWIPGQLAQLSAAADGNVWGVNSAGQIYTFDAPTQSWVWIPGTLSQIAVASGGAVWGVNSEGEIYRYNYAKAGWDRVPGTLAQIAVADRGDVWGLDKRGSVWRFDASAVSWQQMAANFAQLSVGRDGAVWGLDGQGTVYRFDSQAETFAAMAGTMAQISVGSSANIWALDAAGSIYQFNAQTQAWDSIPGQLEQICAGFDGSAWGLNSDQLIFRYAGSGNWDYIPGALASLSVGSDAVVWGINASGMTFYFQ